MPLLERSEALENAYQALSKNYRGLDVDIYAICKEKRRTEPVMTGDFMRSLHVPTHADVRQTYPTYALFNYTDIRKVLADSKGFTNGFMRAGLGSFFGGDGLIVLAMDGPEHKATRALLQPVFMPSNVNRWSGEIKRCIEEDFLTHIVPDKGGDLMQFGLYFPIRIIYQLIGFPDDYTDQFYDFAAQGLTILAGQKLDAEAAEEARRTANAASQGLLDTVIELVARRRAEGAEGDDIISQLIRSEHEGQQLSDFEVATFVRSLVAAGGETTTRTFSSVMTLLLQRPGVFERVKADRSLVPALINEAIRFEPVATVKVRQAAAEVEIGGVTIPKGAIVQCLVASANRDEAVIDNPDEFDIDRSSPMNFTFGFGAHMCVGQFVAKLELEAAVNALLDHMPGLRLDPAYPEPVIVGGQLRGAGSIHVLWD